ncbi:hypothetical protein ACET3Z_026365 [Daucus carota]
MNASHILHIIGALAFMLSLLGSESLSKDDNAIRCIEAEWKALQLFKQGVVRGAQRHDLGSWRDEEKDCCKWKGVGCDNRTGHVTHLFLSSRISAFTDSTSRIPSISVLRINHCQLFAPSSAPGNFSSSISSLHLNGNYINSSIFYWLSHLSGSLVVLDLGNNLLEGRIPQTFCHMSAPTYLDLSANQLNGVPPKCINNLSNLQVVDFSANNFTGNLEHLLFGPFASLQELLISENHLTGSLPDITLFSSLKKLQVSSNQLNGYQPTTFKHHSTLQFLDLSNNHLRGFLPNFTKFSSFRFLNLYNNGFSGNLPDFTGCSSLEVLRLGNNQLTEWQTQSTGQLSSLEELDLSVNSITSTIS